MKPTVILSLLLLCSFISLGQPGGDFFDADTVNAGETVQKIGEPVVTCDEVAWMTVIDTMDGKPALIKLSDHEKGLTLVLWEEDHDLFDQPLKEAFKTGTSVCAGGLIEEFKGTARMEIGHSSQVHWVD